MNYVDELYHHGILGMHWGERRYQNYDGTLTELGKVRYRQDVKDNDARKKDSKIKIDGPDPTRWVLEDLSRAKNVTSSSNQFIRNVDNLIDSTTKKKQIRLYLDDKTNKELQDAINRRKIEDEYNRMFAPSNVSAGKENVKKVLAAGAAGLAVAGTALEVALNVKRLIGSSKIDTDSKKDSK